MRSWVFLGAVLVAFCCCIGFSSLLWIENSRLRDERHVFLKQQTDLKEVFLVAKDKNTRRGEWDVFSLQDMQNFRDQGKIDGKVEALLIMNKTETVNLSPEQIDKIIEIAEKSTAVDNDQFLSLLCRAAYHKGIVAGEEYAREDSQKEYENGYHAAIDDFTCPETGKIVIPPNAKDPMKKP